MKVSVSVDVRAVKKFKVLPAKSKKAVLDRIGAKYISIVTKRTKQGKDTEGQPFKPYTWQYADKKLRAKAAGGRIGQANWLHLTGKMFQSMTISVHANEVRVTFEGQHPATHFVQKSKAKTRKKRKTKRLTVGQSGGKTIDNSFLAWANDQLRPFVGVSKAEAKLLKKVAIRMINKEHKFLD